MIIEANLLSQRLSLFSSKDFTRSNIAVQPSYVSNAGETIFSRRIVPRPGHSAEKPKLRRKRRQIFFVRGNLHAGQNEKPFRRVKDRKGFELWYKSESWSYRTNPCEEAASSAFEVDPNPKIKPESSRFSAIERLLDMLFFMRHWAHCNLFIHCYLTSKDKIPEVLVNNEGSSAVRFIHLEEANNSLSF